MSAETLRKKPACVLRRDAWLTELRQLEDRESLRPWLQKYGTLVKMAILTGLWYRKHDEIIDVHCRRLRSSQLFITPKPTYIEYYAVM